MLVSCPRNPLGFTEGQLVVVAPRSSFQSTAFPAFLLTLSVIFSNHRLGIRSAASWQIR